MKAEYKAKIDNSVRHDLKQVVPLDKPYSIMIDVADACNMNCKFCFHSDLESIKNRSVRFGIMKFDLFKRIIDGIKDRWGEESIKKVRLFANGEPFLNPNIINMIRYTKQSNVANQIEITTNGSLLTENICDELGDSGLDILNISVNALSEKQYMEVCDYKIDYDEFRRRISYLYDRKGGCRIQIKYSDMGYSDEEKKAFTDMFGDICDQIYVESISADLWPNTLVKDKVKSSDKDFWGRKLTEKKICTSIFTQIVINSFGLAKVCCSDWSSSVILGDMNKEGFGEVWNRYLAVQKKFLLNGESVYDMCKGCSLPNVSSSDNLDDDIEDTLKRYELVK